MIIRPSLFYLTCLHLVLGHSHFASAEPRTPPAAAVPSPVAEETNGPQAHPPLVPTPSATISFSKSEPWKLNNPLEGNPSDVPFQAATKELIHQSIVDDWLTNADLGFYGKIVKVETRTPPEYGDPVTFITYNVFDVVLGEFKGDRQITLVLVGGMDESTGMGLSLSEYPEYSSEKDLGKEELVFVKDNGKVESPFLGVVQVRDGLVYAGQNPIYINEKEELYLGDSADVGTPKTAQEKLVQSQKSLSKTEPSSTLQKSKPVVSYDLFIRLLKQRAAIIRDEKQPYTFENYIPGDRVHLRLLIGSAAYMNSPSKPE